MEDISVVLVGLLVDLSSSLCTTYLLGLTPADLRTLLFWSVFWEGYVDFGASLLQRTHWSVLGRVSTLW